MKSKIIIMFILLVAISWKCSEPPEKKDEDEGENSMKTLWEIEYVHYGSSVEGHPLLLGDSLVIISAGKEIFCMKQSDGSIKWKYKLETDFNIQTKIFVTDGEKLFATHAKDIRCWDIETGKIIWIKDMEHEWGNMVGEQIAYYDNKLYVTGDDLYCLDAETGNIIYTKDTPSNDITLYEDKLYSNYFNSTYPDGGIEQRHGILVCFEPSTGDTIWEQSINDGGGDIYMPAICEDSVVYVGSYEHDPSGVQAFDAETGEEIWHTEIEGTCLFKDGLIVDDLLIMNCNYHHIIGLDKNTGEVQYIKYLTSDIISDRLQYYKGWIYAARGVGVYVVDPKTGEIVHSVRGGYKIAVGNDRIFCQDSDKIRCLDIFRAEDTVETNTKIF